MDNFFFLLVKCEKNVNFGEKVMLPHNLISNSAVVTDDNLFDSIYEFVVEMFADKIE